MFTVTLREIIDEFQLEVVRSCGRNPDEVLVTTSDVNRPGLQLTGYMDFFGIAGP